MDLRKALSHRWQLLRKRKQHLELCFLFFLILSSLSLLLSPLGVLTAFMDTLVFLVMATACIVIYTCLEPHKRGFWTHDKSIQYPFRPLTVSLGSILSISFLAPFLVISLTEKYINQKPPLLALKKYAFTIVSNILVNIYVKFVVGRLRPHFLDVCRPSAEVMARNQFVTNFTCHPDVHPRSVSQARQSFYSGHASFAMCAAIYLILYTRDKWSRCLRTSFLQLVMFMIGLYPGLTQVNNYWHHWDDVLFGFFAGTAFAVLGYVYV